MCPFNFHWESPVILQSEKDITILSVFSSTNEDVLATSFSVMCEIVLEITLCASLNSQKYLSTARNSKVGQNELLTYNLFIRYVPQESSTQQHLLGNSWKLAISMFHYT